MIQRTFVVTMATYNRWQNDNLYSAAESLTDEERRRDRGGFFGSIHRTLNHLLWADEVWMGRLSGRAHPRSPIERSPERYADWAELRDARRGLDADIVAWARRLEPSWLLRRPTPIPGRAWRPNPKWTNGFLVTHMFNHQTHHRGQVHAMLTAAGAEPGATDLLVLPDVAAATQGDPRSADGGWPADAEEREELEGYLRHKRSGGAPIQIGVSRSVWMGGVRGEAPHEPFVFLGPDEWGSESELTFLASPDDVEAFIGRIREAAAEAFGLGSPSRDD
ncbi:MAG: DinB family protein [Sandaracinaceae bacterium]